MSQIRLTLPPLSLISTLLSDGLFVQPISHPFSIIFSGDIHLLFFISYDQHFFRLFANQLPQNELKQLFDPSASSVDGADASTSWVVFRVLSKTIQNSAGPLTNEISEHLDRSLAQQLEELGLWHHAVLIRLGSLQVDRTIFLHDKNLIIITKY